jgi:hypothetical protein
MVLYFSANVCLILHEQAGCCEICVHLAAGISGNIVMCQLLNNAVLKSGMYFIAAECAL